MWKNIVQQGSPQMTICRTRIACWIPKATNTRSEYCFSTATTVARTRPTYYVITYTASPVTAEITHALSFSRDSSIKPTFSISGFTV
jgi:hypothetical protein